MDDLRRLAKPGIKKYYRFFIIASLFFNKLVKVKYCYKLNDSYPSLRTIQLAVILRAMVIVRSELKI